MRIDNQQQQNKGVMDLMPQTGAVEEKNGIQMFADAVKTESSKKSAGTTSFQAKEITYLNPAKEEKKTVIDEIEQSGSMDAGERKAQMAVLAETTSPEDYEKMQEDGFSLDDTTSNKIVTVTDKIKAPPMRVPLSPGQVPPFPSHAQMFLPFLFEIPYFFFS